MSLINKENVPVDSLEDDIGDPGQDTPEVVRYVRDAEGLKKGIVPSGVADLFPRLNKMIDEIDSLSRHLDEEVFGLIGLVLQRAKELSGSELSSGILFAQVVSSLKKSGKVKVADEGEMKGGSIEVGKDLDIASAIRIFVDAKQRILSEKFDTVRDFLEGCNSVISFLNSFVKEGRRIFLGAQVTLSEADLVLIEEFVGFVIDAKEKVSVKNDALAAAKRAQLHGADSMFGLVKVSGSFLNVVGEFSSLQKRHGDALRAVARGFGAAARIGTLEQDLRSERYASSVSDVLGTMQLLAGADKDASLGRAAQGVDAISSALLRLQDEIEGLGLTSSQLSRLLAVLDPANSIVSSVKSDALRALLDARGTNNDMVAFQRLAENEPRKMEALLADVNAGRIEEGHRLIFRHFPDLQKEEAGGFPQRLWDYLMKNAFMKGELSGEGGRLLGTGAPTDKHEVPAGLLGESAPTDKHEAIFIGENVPTDKYPVPEALMEEDPIIEVAMGPSLSIDDLECFPGADEGSKSRGGMTVETVVADEMGRHSVLGLYLTRKRERSTSISDTQLLAVAVGDDPKHRGFPWAELVDELDLEKVVVVGISIGRLGGGDLNLAAERLQELGRGMDGFEIEYVEKEGLMFVFAPSGGGGRQIEVVRQAFDSVEVELGERDVLEVDLVAMSQDGAFASEDFFENFSIVMKGDGKK